MFSMIEIIQRDYTDFMYFAVVTKLGDYDQELISYYETVIVLG